MVERSYVCIDLKSFYASVECRQRGLDPMTTLLAVADESRTDPVSCIEPGLATRFIHDILHVSMPVF